MCIRDRDKGEIMQINRLFEIIYILLDKKTVTANELAKKFEVSSRTIYRDVEILSGAGIPVSYTHLISRHKSIASEAYLIALDAFFISRTTAPTANK